MKIVGKKLSIKEFEKYVKDKDFGSIPPSWLVLHHTWKPTELDWNGSKSIASLKAFYEGKGWSAAPHIFVGPDGIWLFTDMYEVGIHAGTGNAKWKSKSTGKIWYGWGNDFTNNQLLGYSIGIEVVGNYDGAKWSGDVKRNAVATLKILMDKLKIKDSDLKFHRDYCHK